jgi:hypothetical protein
MAIVTLALVFVLWELFDLDDIGAAAAGCFLGMLTLVGFTSTGRQMVDDLYESRSMRARIGRGGLREARRAVRDGRAVEDPALAAYAVRLGERSRQVLTQPVARWWVGLTLALVVLNLVRARYVGAGSFAFLLAMTPLPRRFGRGRLAKIERSIAANTQLLGGPASS